jgi:two-component system sensor histidine kinase KdpD
MENSLEKISKPQQYFISIVAILMVAALCYSSPGLIGYRTVALILLVTLSFISVLCDIIPVLSAAILSAFIWDYFFIPPKFTLHVNDADDVLMLIMYFFIVLINAALTYKIRLREKEFNKREHKEDVSKLYNTLLNSLSHELRTPISIIVGATDNLLSWNNRLSEESKRELVGEISEASFRLNRQVENLLNMSRLESGVIKPKKDWCDVNELVYEVVNRLKENYSSRIINISINDNFPLVKLDYVLMEQVLYNLLQNAMQYCPKYCLIAVKANCINNKLVLIVEDNGEGFPGDEMDNVFEKFYRLKNSKTGGIGLGLSIVEGFVEAHNGNIMLENLEEGGAKFTIEIPTEISYVTQLEQ